MRQKYAANSQVVFSLFTISPVSDLNCTVIDQFRKPSSTTHFHIDDSPSLAQAIAWGEAKAQTQC